MLSIPLFLTLQAKEATKKTTKAKAAEAPPTKEPAKKGKRAKAAAVISSSDEDSDSASKKPVAVKKTKISKVSGTQIPFTTVHGKWFNRAVSQNLSKFKH